jgi:alkylated DNA repair dioxygenase AlkB
MGEIVRFAEGLNFTPFAFRGFTGKRRTVSFGWRYDFNGGGFQPSEPMPKLLDEVRAAAAAGVDERAFEQCSIIEYAPGAGIGWRRDRPQFGTVVGISVLGPCRMRFRRERDGGGWDRARSTCWTGTPATSGSIRFRHWRSSATP